jgi:hypothetical protein
MTLHQNTSLFRDAIRFTAQQGKELKNRVQQ